MAKHTQDEIWRGTLQAKVRVALVHRLQFGPALQQRGTRSKAPKIRIATIALQQRGTKIGLLPSGIAARLRGDNRVPQTFWNNLPSVGSSRSQATMEALKEMYAKVGWFDKKIEECDQKVQLCRTCREKVDANIEIQNKLIQQRQYWLDRIGNHKDLVDYLQSKADERKAKEEAKRKAEEEEEVAPEASAEEEADKAATRRPIAKSALLLKKPRTREI